MMEPQINFAQCHQKVCEQYIVFHDNNIYLLFHAISYCPLQNSALATSYSELSNFATVGNLY